MPVNFRNFLEKPKSDNVVPTIDVVGTDTGEPEAKPASPPKSSKLNAKSMAAPRLRYLKFKAKTVTSTIEFYQVLGMSLDYNLKFPSVPLGDNLIATSTKTLMAFSYPPITLSKEDAEARRITSGAMDDKKPNFQILFEHNTPTSAELLEVFKIYNTHR